MRRFVALLFGLGVAAWVGGGTAVAQAPAQAPAAGVGAAQEPATAPAAPPDRRMQMTETITAADYKQIEGGPLLIAAYAVVWVVFFFAVVFLFLRLRRVSREMHKLEARVERAAGEKPR